MPEDEKQQSKADLSAYTIELRQLRMEEKAMRKVFEECSGQLTQLQVLCITCYLQIFVTF